MEQLIVRNFISKNSKMSRVTLDTHNFELISGSSKDAASGRVPALTSVGYVKHDGLNFNKYMIGDVAVYYAWDKSKRGKKVDGPNIFLMDTAIAEKLHKPWAGQLVESLDMGEELDMNNSLDMGEAVK